jgi:hypothetical protein
MSHTLEKEPYKALDLIKEKKFLDLICFIKKDNELVVNYCKKNKKVKAK